ncbi:hypothetical protein AB0H57_32045 [Micromonospora sp. NPDC050686]|uniref:hypothetical protein n=1 Tax=Micromonospora sp. NPDC050686 TaxID=3154631 RepID=UPI0033C49975
MLVPLVLVASGVFVLRWLSVQEPPKLPEPFREQLAARVVDIIEHDPTFDGKHDPDARPVCAASVFGVAPDSADTIDEVRTIYTLAFCQYLPNADIGKGPGIDLSSLGGVSMPIALHLGPPVTHQEPEEGEGMYTDSIRRIFPKSLQEAAFNAETDPAMKNAVDDRITRLLSSPMPSPSHS